MVPHSRRHKIISLLTIWLLLMLNNLIDELQRNLRVLLRVIKSILHFYIHRLALQLRLDALKVFEYLLFGYGRPSDVNDMHQSIGCQLSAILGFVLAQHFVRVDRLRSHGSFCNK